LWGNHLPSLLPLHFFSPPLSSCIAAVLYRTSIVVVFVVAPTTADRLFDCVCSRTLHPQRIVSRTHDLCSRVSDRLPFLSGKSIVSQIILLTRESSLEILLLSEGSEVATTPFAQNVPRSYPFANGSLHSVSSFCLRYLLTYDPFYIKRMPRASPSLHLIVPVHWGIYLHYEKKQGPGCKRPFLPFLRVLCSRSRNVRD